MPRACGGPRTDVKRSGSPGAARFVPDIVEALIELGQREEAAELLQ